MALEYNTVKAHSPEEPRTSTPEDRATSYQLIGRGYQLYVLERNLTAPCCALVIQVI